MAQGILYFFLFRFGDVLLCIGNEEFHCYVDALGIRSLTERQRMSDWGVLHQTQGI